MGQARCPVVAFSDHPVVLYHYGTHHGVGGCETGTQFGQFQGHGHKSGVVHFKAPISLFFLRTEKGFQFGHKVVDVLELSVHRCKPDVGDIIDFMKCFHQLFTDFP